MLRQVERNIWVKEQPLKYWGIEVGTRMTAREAPYLGSFYNRRVDGDSKNGQPANPQAKRYARCGLGLLGRGV